MQGLQVEERGHNNDDIELGLSLARRKLVKDELYFRWVMRLIEKM